MGTVSAKVLDEFQVLSVFPYSQPGHKDIMRLDRRVDKALRQIKYMNLPDWVVKGLLCDGFKSKRLISWLNKLIDENINHKNMSGFFRLATLFKGNLENIDRIEPLTVLYQKYRDFVLNGMKPQASKIIFKLALLIAPLVIHLEGERSKQDGEEFSSQILLKVDDSLVSLESSYINDNFSNEAKNRPLDSTLVTSFGLISVYNRIDDAFVTVPRDSYSYEKEINGKRYINIPKTLYGLEPYVGYDNSIIYYSVPVDKSVAIPLRDYVYNNGIKYTDDWYQINAYSYRPSEYAIECSPYGTRYMLLYDVKSIELFNNPEGVKVENSNLVYYTSQPITQIPYGSSKSSYTSIRELTGKSPNTLVSIPNPGYKDPYSESGQISVIGPYGYLCAKTDLRTAELKAEYNQWAYLFLKQQNKYPIPSA